LKSPPLSSTSFITELQHDVNEVSIFQRSTVHEPSVASIGSIIFFTANWYAARSTDGGSSFTYVNPRTTFNSPPHPNDAFCCDQIVQSDTAHNMIMWALLYDQSDSSGNFTGPGAVRITSAIGAAVAANNWNVYDFDPQFFGLATNKYIAISRTSPCRVVI
jgi:hypothetical protein